MDIRKLQRAIVDGLEDVKAHDILVFNTEHLSPLFERVIVATGSSNRQTKALASSVRVAVRSAGLPVLATEGADNGEWIIVDCGAAVAHIMQPDIRRYYHLEEIWGGKPVKLKLGDGAAKGLVKASEPDDEPASARRKPGAKAAAGKASATSVAPKQAAAQKSATRKSPARKMPDRPTAAKKSATRSAPATKTIVARPGKARPAAKSPAARKATPARAAPRRAASGKAVAGKSAPRRPAAKRG